MARALNVMAGLVQNKSGHDDVAIIFEKWSLI